MDCEKTILDLSYSEIKELVLSLGQPEYRAGQIMSWLYRGLVTSFAEMTDLPGQLREVLAGKISVSTLIPIDEKSSPDDQVRKVLFKLHDSKTVEAVLMVYDTGRRTVCVSSQVGCPVGCPFCATGQQGFERNLFPGEIVEQVLYFERVLRKGLKNAPTERLITNVVFMGMGEPLANYSNLTKALALLNDSRSFGLGARQVTLSTAGLIPQIRALTADGVKVELALSLHAPNDKLRDWLVPVNTKYPIKDVLDTCWDFFGQTGRRPTFEYILFRGVNDSPELARELANLLKGKTCLVNIIPANSTGNPVFRPPSRSTVMEFEAELRKRGIPCMIRDSKGADIQAGCGQLRSQWLKNE